MSSIGRAWNPRAGGRARAIVILIVLAGVIALCGCGNDDDDENPMEPGPSEPARSTPTELLTEYFEKAYTQQDSTLYARMLDEAFTFQFLQADADSLRDLLGNDNFWGKSTDVASTKAMFRNPDVISITLNIIISSDLPDKSCAGCRRVESTITLRVETVVGGPETLVFAIDSPQTFIVKPDPSDSTKLVLLRQIDWPADGKTEPLASENGSWGGIKGLFSP
jgi:hypothetical protein